MGIADSMKGITENITASYDVRVKALKDLVVDTRKTIKGFASDRKQMSADRKQMSKEQAKNLIVLRVSTTKSFSAFTRTS